MDQLLVMMYLDLNYLIEVLRIIVEFFMQNIFDLPARELIPEKPLVANCVRALIALGDN
mgnify:CR=1 FL=1